MSRLKAALRLICMRNRYLRKIERVESIYGKAAIQSIAALMFLVLTVANIIARSYTMLMFTAIGCVANIIIPLIAVKTKNLKLISRSSIIFCSLLFASFVISGGNDGFACLWIAFMPIFSMAIMDFSTGFVTTVILQIYLILMFWTPLKTLLHYPYNEQFLFRFPLYYFTSFIMSVVMTITLQKSRYDAEINLREFENATKLANTLAKTDTLTGLANRRQAYEVFEATDFDGAKPHCIIMADVDEFKIINDTYNHEFGDKVLVTIANYFKQFLPEDYLKVRWGGEEFLLAANAPIDEVYEKMEALRTELAKHNYFFEGKLVHVTMTFGIAEYHEKKDLEVALTTADDRMYAGKRAGRNRVVRD